MTVLRSSFSKWTGALAHGLAFGILVAVGYLVFWAFSAQAAFADAHLLILAAVAGIASFFSPCAFPLLPSYLAFYHSAASTRKAGVGRGLQLGVAAAFGVVAFDLILGAAIAVLGSGVGESLSISSDEPSQLLLIFRAVVGIALLALGFSQLAGWNLKPKIADSLAFWTRPQRQSYRRSETSLFLYGLGYNAAGMGCTGPILAGLAIASLASGGFASALSAFFIFALTMGALMLLISLFVGASRQQLIQQLKIAGPRIRTISALAMVAVGIFQLYTSLALDQFRYLFFP
jgi:cytochrome c-type biogenesis protein